MDTTVMAAILAELGFCQEEIEEMTEKEDPGESCDCQDSEEEKEDQEMGEAPDIKNLVEDYRTAVELLRKEREEVRKARNKSHSFTYPGLRDRFRKLDKALKRFEAVLKYAEAQDEKEPADCNQTDSRTSTTNNSTTGGTI